MFKEMFTEAYLEEAKAQRAWNNRLKNLDNLMAWMYDKDILTKAEKNKKDSLFSQYYRYYNDGDWPRVLSKKGISKYAGADEIQTSLEEELENFIKSILQKYNGKYDRGTFRYDQFIKNIEGVLGSIQEDDADFIINFWKKKITDPNILKQIAKLEEVYNTFTQEIDKIDPEHTNIVTSYRIAGLTSKKRKEIDPYWKAVQRELAEVEEKVQNLITAVKKMKKLRALK